MSVTINIGEGVTVFTLTLSLCCGPACCSLPRQLKKVQWTSVDLGVMQIMIGLLNFSLGLILHISKSRSVYIYTYFGYPWFGAVFTLLGIACVWSNRYPSPLRVLLSVMLNLIGAAFALGALGLYVSNIVVHQSWDWCSGYYWPYQHTTPSPEELKICSERKALLQLLQGILMGISAVLIFLSVLELCVVISSAVLGIKALNSSDMEPNETPDDPEATAG